jgi:TolA-binding protein
MIKKTLIHTALVLGAVSTLYSAEVSVFEAGNINSDSPYGLTENEKILFEQRQQIEKLSKELAHMRSQYERLEGQIEGVQSVLDGTASRVGQSDAQAKTLVRRVEFLDSNLSSISAQFEQLKELANQTREVQETNNERVRTVLAEISSLIDSINANYAPKSQLDALEQKIEAIENSKTSQTNSSDLESKEGAVLIKEALEHFEANRLDESKIRYELLVQKNYMPARSNYYLGEIAYKKEQWRTAIKHYKISIDLYDKADYIPKLLYHTAISFDKIGEPSNANPFYNALKTNYPNSKEAKAAPNR